MRHLEFTELAEETRTLLKRTREAFSHSPETHDLVPQIDEILLANEQETELRVALVGHYSAGKSTIVKALTGVEVAIGAGVTTQKAATYTWKGLVVVDTPGIHADTDENSHDMLARNESVRADLVLFVLTGDLPGPRLAAHLQWLADPAPAGLGLAPKMAVIVNKMDREINDPAVILGAITKVTASHPQIPILLCAARSALDAREAAPDIRDELLAESRWDELVEALDIFVRERGVTGRLATPVQRAEEVLMEATRRLTGSSPTRRREREGLEVQRRVLVTAITDYDRKVADSRARIRAAYGKAATEVTKDVREDSTPESLADAIDARLQAQCAWVDAHHASLDAGLRHIVLRATESIAAPAIAEGLPQWDRPGAAGHVWDVNDAPDGSPDSARKVADAAGKVLRGALKNAAKDTAGLHDVVLKLGRLVGKKFRPHEAIKLAGKLGKTAKVLTEAAPFIGIAFDLYFAHREEKATEERRQYVASLRAAIQRMFNGQADLEIRALEEATMQFRRASLDAAASQVEQALAALTSGAARDGHIGGAIAGFAAESHALRRRIAART